MMNQLIASTLLSAIVLAVVYLFLRVMSLEEQVKTMNTKQVPVPELDALWQMTQEQQIQQVMPDMLPPGAMDLAYDTAPQQYGPSRPCANELQSIEEIEAETMDQKCSGEVCKLTESLAASPPLPTPSSVEASPPKPVRGLPSNIPCERSEDEDDGAGLAEGSEEDDMSEDEAGASDEEDEREKEKEEL